MNFFKIKWRIIQDQGIQNQYVTHKIVSIRKMIKFYYCVKGVLFEMHPSPLTLLGHRV